MRSIANSKSILDRWKSLWALPIPLKVKCFSWLFLQDRVALRERFYRLGLIQEKGKLCPICGEGREEGYHLFIHCSRIYRLWRKVARLWDLTFVGERVTCPYILTFGFILGHVEYEKSGDFSLRGF